MKAKTNYEVIGFITEIKELIKDTPLAGKLDVEKIVRENENAISLDDFYDQFLDLKKQIEPYEQTWKIGDILVTKNQKELMIVYNPEAKQNYQLINLSTGETEVSFSSIKTIKEHFNYSIFNLVGEIEPKVLKVKRYK